MTESGVSASPRRIHADVSEVLFSEERIAARVAELGRRISADYRAMPSPPSAESPLLAVGILRGAAIFSSDLARAIDLPVEMDYMAVSSYGNAAQSSGEVRIVKDLSSSIEGRHVLVVEDILDSGLTLERLLRELESRGPASVEVACLLRKEGAQRVDIDCKYVGFECPGEFIVGYGLDFAQRYRNLPYIGILKPDVYQGR